MSLFNVDVTEVARLSRDVADMAARSFNHNALLGDVGYLMVNNEIPHVFGAEGMPRWQQKGPMAVPGKLLDLTGRLRKSQGYSVRGSVLTVGTGVPYGGTHQMGKRIRVLRAQYLAIPFPNLWPSEYRLPVSAFRNTFMRITARGNRVIFQRTGRGSNDIRPLFLLKKSVKVPQRAFLSWREVAVETFADRMIHFIYWGNFPAPGGVKPSHGGYFDTMLGWAA